MALGGLLRESIDSAAMDAPETNLAMSASSDTFPYWSPDLMADCHSSLRGLYEYWDDKRGARAMPARGDLDPADLKRMLPHLILIDVVADPRRYIYRLVGTREVELRGSDPTGKRIHGEAMSGAHSRYIRSIAEETMSRRAPIF